MISCIIIEDQPPAQRILQKYINDIGNLELQGTFADALSAMEFLNNKSIDLIFLDIHLPKISGIDFLNVLPQKPDIILTTAFADYALKGYELDVLDYLLKPFSFERFVKAVAKVNRTVQNQIVAPPLPGNIASEATEAFLFVKIGTDYQKIEIAEIRFIKSNGDYTQLFMENAKHLASQSLKHWIEKLDQKWFCQIHKSYLINIRHIRKVSGNQVYIGDNMLPIGRTFKENFFNNYLEGDQ